MKPNVVQLILGNDNECQNAILVIVAVKCVKEIETIKNAEFASNTIVAFSY